MRQPIFVRHLTQLEQNKVQAGLSSRNSIVSRHCRIVLLSSRGQPVASIAKQCACTGQTVRNTIHAFNEYGLKALQVRSSRPHTIQAAFSSEQQQALLAILALPPKAFGRQGIDAYTWTYRLLAEICFEQGVLSRKVTAETVRATLVRMQVDWLKVRFLPPDSNTRGGVEEFLEEFLEEAATHLSSSWGRTYRIP